MNLNRFKSILYIICTLFIFTLFGCDIFSLDTTSGDIKSLIDKNKREWEESGVSSYNFSYNKTVGDEAVDSVEVVVSDGRVDTVWVQGKPVDDESRYLTIDRLFDEIVRYYNLEDRGSFQVKFDEDLSYPKRYRMLPGENTTGRGVVVYDFSVRNEGADSN